MGQIRRAGPVHFWRALTPSRLSSVGWRRPPLKKSDEKLVRCSKAAERFSRLSRCPISSARFVISSRSTRTRGFLGLCTAFRFPPRNTFLMAIAGVWAQCGFEASAPRPAHPAPSADGLIKRRCGPPSPATGRGPLLKLSAPKTMRAGNVLPALGTNCRRLTVKCRLVLLAAYCLLPSAYCLLAAGQPPSPSTLDCQLLTADCQLPQYIPPPMPPPPGGIGCFSSFSGISQINASVVSMSEAMEAAFWSAVRVTLVGSMTPASTKSP